MAYIAASINLTRLKEVIIEDPSLISFKTKKGEAYINIIIWVNFELDEWNNDCSIQLSVPKEHTKLEKTIYLGNGRTEKAFDEIRRKKISESKIHTSKQDETSQVESVEIVNNNDFPF